MSDTGPAALLPFRGVEDDARPDEARAARAAAHFEVHVGYIPGDRLVGLSKLARLVEHYARRPQIQERLTMQVVGLLEERLRPAGSMVVVQARRFCVEVRAPFGPRRLNPARR